MLLSNNPPITDVAYRVFINTNVKKLMYDIVSFINETWSCYDVSFNTWKELYVMTNTN